MRSTLVSTFLRTTFVPGTAAWAGSVTTPLTAEEELCPKAAIVSAGEHTARRTRIKTSLIELKLRRIDMWTSGKMRQGCGKVDGRNPIKTVKQMSRKLLLIGKLFYWRKDLDSGNFCVKRGKREYAPQSRRHLVFFICVESNIESASAIL